MSLILLFSFFLLKVSASLSQITGHGNTTAVYGRDAVYKCTAANPKGVLQVTWQRLFKDESIENLATYSKRFGKQVNDPYRGKVVFTEASLHSTSITLKNVTWQDESCYICSFNVYPDGSQRKQTCLTVQGLSEVHAKSTSAAPRGENVEVVFSCFATGKPAPTIDWEISPSVTPLDQPQSTTVANSDQTFSTSRNITLQVPRNWDGHVDCLLNTGMAGQMRQKMDFYPDPVNPESKTGSAVIVVVVIVLISCVIVATAVLIKKNKRLKRYKGTEHV